MFGPLEDCNNQQVASFPQQKRSKKRLGALHILSVVHKRVFKHRKAPIEGGFILDTDISNIEIGGLLSQEQECEGELMGHFSKVLSKPEQNFCLLNFMSPGGQVARWIDIYKIKTGPSGCRNADALSRSPPMNHVNNSRTKMTATARRTTVVNDQRMNADMVNAQVEDIELTRGIPKPRGLDEMKEGKISLAGRQDFLITVRLN
ncbi:hypothetical protein J6590_088777 [Homalodisca vitripennis]|nr:hypothetical protein J6590_088777 [Homalodisca vitripennis]